ncbi:MAG: type II toxin-antitoxin system Phd/YefM family antitoxin [Alphaproteobacteria bacterium]|nr:type II toxin-antitoxin system Phd/YefM family antitoxin [Alphaproteobacteria bacterium]
MLAGAEIRANLKEVLDRVVDDRAPVVITRQEAESVVMAYGAAPAQQLEIAQCRFHA